MSIGRLIRATALAVCATVLVAACASPSSKSSSTGPASGPTDAAPGSSALDKTFTYAVGSDPGALDPTLSASATQSTMAGFVYDALVNVDMDGNAQSGIASEWTQDADKATFTIKDGITCSDGSAMTAQTVADNLNFVADPANASPWLGVSLPVGATAEADGSTVTLNLAEPAPFLLTGLSGLFLVCDAGLADRSVLTGQAIGTGPYTLEDVVPNDHYTYKIRDDYAWGPNGATTAGSSMPGTLVVRVIESESTIANLLLTGEINAAMVLGADSLRLEAEGMGYITTPFVYGEQWYNHAEGHVTSDPAVRSALTQAVDLAELRQVLTSGVGTPPTSFTVNPPAGCTGGQLADYVPAYDVEAAKSTLDAAGWTAGSDGKRSKDGVPLKVSLLYMSSNTAAGAAGAELAKAGWEAVGFEVEIQQLSADQVPTIVFGTGDWDLVWLPFSWSTPSSLVPYASGPSMLEGGNNFSYIDNPEYSAKVAVAASQIGQAGCATWLDAETELMKANNITVFANVDVKTYFTGSVIDRSFSASLPTAISMAE
ncbi:MAG: ABC transporter substrate-binding protein [Bifidobacteriaceae bacterium]|jgi:peptide/nickel transport system substrate-binding protein|nr:ABC transporter substrate-binding protein [Bifidobacteriaceae bacterium]